MATEVNCDDRKFRKPLMEKKRRARINESLDNLKQILLECDPESVNKKNAKLEKADILEMTVKYLKNMRKPVQSSPTSYSNNSYASKGFSSSQQKYGGYTQGYIAAPFSSGSQMYYGSSSYSYEKKSSYNQNYKQANATSGIWRPW